MIQVQAKRYQIMFWELASRDGPAALLIEFDAIEEARREFTRLRDSGLYGTGVMMEWRKETGEWNLLERFS